MIDEKLEELKGEELDIYIGKITREYINLRARFEKIQIKYDDLNCFLEDKARNNIIETSVKIEEHTVVKNLNEIPTHPVILADKVAREEKSLQLCNNGEIGLIKRDISTRPQIKIPKI